MATEFSIFKKSEGADGPAIKPGLANIITLAISLAAPFIAKIKDEYARTQLERFVEPLKEVIKALSDADPEDGKQIQAIIYKFFSQTGFSQDTKDLLLKVVANDIEDERLKKLITYFLTWTFDLVPILLDEVRPNDKQIVDYMKLKLKNDEGKSFVQNLLSFVIEDQDTALWLAEIIIQLIDTVTKD